MIYDISPILYRKLTEQFEIQREEALEVLKATTNIASEKELAKLPEVLDEMTLYVEKVAAAEIALETLRKNFT